MTQPDPFSSPEALVEYLMSAGPLEPKIPTIEVTALLGSDDVGYCELLVDTPDGPQVFTGSSRRHPNDSPDAGLGAKYAFARALKAAGVAILQDAKRECDLNDRARKAMRAREVAAANRQRKLQRSKASRELNAELEQALPKRKGKKGKKSAKLAA